MNRKPLLGLVLLLVLVLPWTACGNSVQGAYSDMSGAFILEVWPGGEATLTFQGEAMPCTYRVDKNQLMLDCKGDKTVFTIHDDGSLTGPPGTSWERCGRQSHRQSERGGDP